MKSLPNLTDIFDMKRRRRNRQLVFKGEKVNISQNLHFLVTVLLNSPHFQWLFGQIKAKFSVAVLSCDLILSATVKQRLM